VSAAEAQPVPPSHLRFRRPFRPIEAVRQLFHARELIRTLAERELRVRYKQAVLGLAWAFITPLALTLVFSVFIRRVANIDTGPAPYQVFAYLGLLPWTFFSTSVSVGGQSLVQNIPLLNRVYCPREVFPLASVMVAGFDMLVALVPFGALLIIYGFLPKVTSYWVPVLLVVQVVFSLAVALIVSAIVVYLRDLRHALPIILQLGLFASPVAYGLDAVPVSLQPLYVTLNPLGAVIDGYRRAVLYGLAPDWGLVLPAAVSALLMLSLGYYLFKRMETGFADVA
jgi:ABC-2 type transport system permease protein/lipopolysaccharide transport system permease protein